MTDEVKDVEPIPRGADLTDEDLWTIVDDFYDVRNWAALKMRMKPDQLKQHLFCALQVRLGRRPQTRDGDGP